MKELKRYFGHSIDQSIGHGHGQVYGKLVTITLVLRLHDSNVIFTVMVKVMVTLTVSVTVTVKETVTVIVTVTVTVMRSVTTHLFCPPPPFANS
jgi:hypothetical protein